MKGSKFYDNLLNEHKKKHKTIKKQVLGSGRLLTEKVKFGSL
jgi:hypothetical protein